MTIKSKCGKYSVNIIQNGKDGNNFMACACFNQFDSESMSDSQYWFTIGRYKSVKNAVRQSIKKLSVHRVELAV